VLEGGRYVYHFRCPSCGAPKMRITGYIVVRGMEEGIGEPRPEFFLDCSGCGERRAVASLPITEHLLDGQ
jgi:hypothetical protein